MKDLDTKAMLEEIKALPYPNIYQAELYRKEVLSILEKFVNKI